MNARPALERIMAALAAARLECILIGNAAAALQGAPVTTLDFDFFFRDTPINRKKLIRFAKELGATVFRPYYPASSMYRVTDGDLSIQADFLGVIHGIRSYEGARKRSTSVVIDGHELRVLSLEDIVRSKAAANRAKDRAVMPTLEATLHATRNQTKNKTRP
jgi:predicted nucleotidyltransferase